MKTHFQILIVGGGNAGISVAAQLLRKNKQLDIAIIDPAEKHYYQPAWTLVGAGVYDAQDTERSEAEVIPDGAQWLKESVLTFDPDNNRLVTTEAVYSYDYLIVAPGIQLNWSAIKGLPETLGQNGVCSNYSFKTAPYTFECLQNFKGGRAIFHSPNTLVKCGGAPQKIMYMAADYFHKHGLAEKSRVEFWSGGTKLFAVPKYEKTLLGVCERNHIQLNFFQRLDEIDGPNKRAKFVGIGQHNRDVITWVDFEMIHITPPQSAPDFVSQSPLANAAGWVDVNKATLQHNQYPNVFSIGDASALPTSKTGAAIRKQAPVLVDNLLALMEQRASQKSYNGYTSCPILTGYGKLVLAEFDYNNTPQETFPFDQSKERWSMYMLKKEVLPRLYWSQILTGRM